MDKPKKNMTVSIDGTVKNKAAKLAASQSRSLSNLIEYLLKREIAEAEKKIEE